jgi:hypothetical protein
LITYDHASFDWQRTLVLFRGSPVPHAKDNVGTIVSAGLFAAGLAYWNARGYTPERLVDQARQTKEKIENSRMKHLMGKDALRNEGTVLGIVGGDFPLIKTLADIENYQLRITEHNYWLKKAKDKYSSIGPNTFYSLPRHTDSIQQALDDYDKNMIEVVTIINTRLAQNLKEERDRQRDRQLSEKNIKLEERRVGTEEVKATAAMKTAQAIKIEAFAKWSETALKYWKHILFLAVAAPSLLLIHAWTREIPLPSFHHY